MSRLERWFHGVSVWRRFSGHLSEHRAPLSVVVLITLLGVGLDLARPWPIQWIFDNALVPDGPRPHGPAFYVLTGAGALMVIALASAWFGYLAALLSTRVGHSVTRSLRNVVFAHLCRLSPAYHASHKTGDLLVRLMGDVPILRTMLVDSSVAITSRVLLIVGTITVMAFVDPLLTVVVLAVLPLVALVVRLLASRLTIAVRKQRRKEGRLADYLHEAIGATPVIQSLGREGETARAFARESRTAARAEMKTAKLAARMSASVESLLGLALAVAIGFGAWRVVGGHLKPGVLLAFLSYVRGLSKPLRSASKHADKVAKGAACGDRILSVLDEPIVIASRPDALPVPGRPGRLEFEGVHFQYADGTPALRGVDACFRRGAPTAVFGASGAGKSTLAALAIRLYDPSAGSVRLDGVDLRDYELGALRDAFGVSLQETVLFGATVRENLELGHPEAAADAMWEALRLAGAADFVAALPDGLDTELGASGVGLSGGERRRLCLARAFLRGSPVLVVDEPFAGLDRLAVRRVIETLGRAAEDRIVIVITHERDDLELFDQVLFVEDGVVRGNGGHLALLQQDGSYRTIAASRREIQP